MRFRAMTSTLGTAVMTNVTIEGKAIVIVQSTLRTTLGISGVL
jgi:ATP-dependent Clp protease adapter protein ClpS